MIRATHQLPPSRQALVEQCYAGAYGALSAGRDALATRLFMTLALLAPRDERAWVGLAVLQERRGAYASAASVYEVGQSLIAGSMWCPLGRARALKRLGRYQEAESAFDEAASRTDDEVMQHLIEIERTES